MTYLQNKTSLTFISFSTSIKWAILNPRAGRFWPAVRMFDTHDLESCFQNLREVIVLSQYFSGYNSVTMNCQ